MCTIILLFVGRPFSEVNKCLGRCYVVLMDWVDLLLRRPLVRWTLCRVDVLSFNHYFYLFYGCKIVLIKSAYNQEKDQALCTFKYWLNFNTFKICISLTVEFKKCSVLLVAGFKKKLIFLKIEFRKKQNNFFISR